MNFLSYLVCVLGIFSLTLSLYLWWFFHQSSHRMGSAVKWMFIGEATATFITLLFWFLIDVLRITPLQPDLANLMRGVAFIVCSFTSIHMSYQINQIE